MIIEKISNGNVLVKTDMGEIKASLVATMILHTHPRNETALLVSMTPSIQDTEEAYYMDHREVSKLVVDGVETLFNGTKVELLELLSRDFFYASTAEDTGGDKNWETTFTIQL